MWANAQNSQLNQEAGQAERQEKDSLACSRPCCGGAGQGKGLVTLLLVALRYPRRCARKDHVCAMQANTSTPLRIGSGHFSTPC